jgi:hypothetical protein
MKTPTYICRGFTDKQWKTLRPRLEVQGDVGAWKCAIEVFKRRMTERFLSCIDAIIAADSSADSSYPVDDSAPADCSTLPNDEKQVVVPGFAIVGLCCLLIEALQSFRSEAAPAIPVEGQCTFPAGACIRPMPTSTTDHFIAFLRTPSFAGAFDDDRVAKKFVGGIRNGILHEAETRKWRIWRDEPDGKIVDEVDDRFVLNRSAFYSALKAEFARYLEQLRDPTESDLRNRFLKKMDDIAREC